MHPSFTIITFSHQSVRKTIKKKDGYRIEIFYIWHAICDKSKTMNNIMKKNTPKNRNDEWYKEKKILLRIVSSKGL